MFDGTKYLNAVVENGTVIEVYTYDALGRRLKVVNSAETTINFARGTETGYEIKKDTSTGNAISTTKYISVNGKYLAKVVQESGQQSQKYFHHVDIVGLIRAITDINGNIIARYDYEPFGLITSATGTDDDNLGFTGKRLDGTGLSYFGARYYDAEIGRFISRDPIRSGRNWFVYCNNNPLVYVDPTGYMLSPKQILDPNSPYYDEEYAKVFLANLLDIFGDPAAVEDYVMNILYPNGVYDSIDEAAIAFGMSTNPKSIDEEREYSSQVIGVYDRYGNLIDYTYNDPVAGTKSSSPRGVFGSGENAVDSKGRRVYALMHTHGSYSYNEFNDEEFSISNNGKTGDGLFVIDTHFPLYMVTPGGQLRELTYTGLTGDIIWIMGDPERQHGFNDRLVSDSMPKDPNFGL